jgi:hypothetical protein
VLYFILVLNQTPKHLLQLAHRPVITPFAPFVKIIRPGRFFIILNCQKASWTNYANYAQELLPIKTEL